MVLRKSIRDRILLVALAVLVFSADQASKYLVLTRLPLGGSWNPVSSLKPFISVTHVVNPGAAFGLFPDQGSLFAVIAVIVVGAILVYYRYLPTQNWMVRLSLSLQLGGALGNLADRLQHGHVIDFIDFKIWPVFNLADVAIVTGVGILAYFLLQEPEGGDHLELNGVADTATVADQGEGRKGDRVSPFHF
ncbi:MAG: Lipoprotein signal peptidase [Anaerolineales bacterium]|nr:Lipoprotein signal peptidase [Anaerolineales bacterium]